MPSTPSEVLAAFSLLTGIHLRYASYNQNLMLDLFCKHFNVDELALVVGYVQGQIAVGKLDSRSLSFKNIFGEVGAGNELASFQDRLAFAQKTVRVRPATKQVPRTTDVGDGKITVFAPEQEPEAEPASDLIRQQFEQMKAANAKMRTNL